MNILQIGILGAMAFAGYSLVGGSDGMETIGGGRTPRAAGFLGSPLAGVGDTIYNFTQPNVNFPPPPSQTPTNKKSTSSSSPLGRYKRTGRFFDNPQESFDASKTDIFSKKGIATVTKANTIEAIGKTSGSTTAKAYESKKTGKWKEGSLGGGN